MGATQASATVLVVGDDRGLARPIQRALEGGGFNAAGAKRAVFERMKRGALDYLVKDVQCVQFVPTDVHRALRQLEKDAERKRSEQPLHRAGLIGAELAVWSRAGQGAAVVCTLRRKQ